MEKQEYHIVDTLICDRCGRVETFERNNLSVGCDYSFGWTNIYRHTPGKDEIYGICEDCAAELLGDIEPSDKRFQINAAVAQR